MKTSKSKIGSLKPDYYSYYLRRKTLKNKDIAENILFASGNGGEYTFIVEDLDLTVVLSKETTDLLKQNRFPKFYFIALCVHNMYKFAVIVCCNFIKDSYTVFFELIYKTFNILNAIINHKIFFRR